MHFLQTNDIAAAIISPHPPPSDGHMFHIAIVIASAHLNGLYIKRSAGHSHPLPYFAFHGWDVVVIVNSSY